MVLFLISFLMIFLSSYFLSSILNKEKNILGLIYIFLFAFANIILTMEVLSLFSAISQSGVLLINTLIFILSVILWNKFGRQLWYINLKNFFNKFWMAIQLDKGLMILTAGFLIFIACSLFMCIVYPVINPDASAYHVLRSLFWIENKNLSHFIVADSRCLHLPINSELIYTWIFLFLKKELFLAFPSFFGYVISMISIFKILDFMKYTMRQKLWVIYMLSSFAFVIVQASSTETDIIIAGLVSSSILLFLYGIKEKNEVPIIISALSYAIAVGVKTPSIFTIPMIGAGFTYYLFNNYGKKDFYKPILRFLGYGTIFFIVFSMYNYLQNFLEWGNIAGSRAFLSVHKNYEGLKAIPATFIKHLFLYFDFTGFTWGDSVGKYVLTMRDFIINHSGVFNPPDGVYSTKNVINQTLLEPLMGPGILGMLVLIPACLISLIKPIFKHDKRTLILGFFGGMLLVNIAVMSYAIPFMTFSVRFLMYFTVISAPILVYTYKKRGIYKAIIILFSMFYMTMIPTHLWARNITKFFTAMKTGISFSTARNLARCTSFPPKHVKFTKEEYESLKGSGKCAFETDFKKHFGVGSKVLIFSNQVDELLDFKLNQFYGYTIDTNLLENIDRVDLNDYDVIITADNNQYATTFTRFATGIPLPAGVDCIYVTSTKLTDTSKQYPSSTVCSIKEDYFKSKGFDGLIKTKYSLIPNSPGNQGKTKTVRHAFMYYKTNRNK